MDFAELANALAAVPPVKTVVASVASASSVVVSVVSTAATSDVEVPATKKPSCTALLKEDPPKILLVQYDFIKSLYVESFPFQANNTS